MPSRLRPFLRGVWVLALVLAAGCGDDDRVARPDTGSLTGVAAAPNPRNALSVLVDFESAGLTSVQATAWKPGEAPERTPVQAVGDGSHRLAVLGLSAETPYRVAVEGWGEGGLHVRSDSVEVTTGVLPIYMRYQVKLQLDVEPAVPPSGYLVANVRRQADSRFTVIFDFSGNLRWYRQWDVVGGFGEQAEDGNLTAFLGTTTGYNPSYGYYAEVGPDGEILRTHQAPPPLYTDNHEILLTPGLGGPTAHFLSYEIRTLDLSSRGGSATARVAGHQILRYGPGGNLEFMWNAWDHLDLDDWVLGTPPESCTLCDFDHPNSLAPDVDGDYILSVRNLSQVLKIDSGTGDILWRLGGRSGEFTFVNDPEDGFSGQHSVRVVGKNRLLLYDNGTEHVPQESRAVEYALDVGARTATLVWEHRHSPPLYTSALGSVQRLEDGSTLVGFGAAGVASLVSPAGVVLWEVELMIDDVPATRTYRFQRIASLYGAEAP